MQVLLGVIVAASRARQGRHEAQAQVGSGNGR